MVNVRRSIIGQKRYKTSAFLAGIADKPQVSRNAVVEQAGVLVALVGQPIDIGEIKRISLGIDRLCRVVG